MRPYEKQLEKLRAITDWDLQHEGAKELIQYLDKAVQDAFQRGVAVGARQVPDERDAVQLAIEGYSNQGMGRPDMQLYAPVLSNLYSREKGFKP